MTDARADFDREGHDLDAFLARRGDAQAGGELTQVNPQIVSGVAQAMRVQTGGLGGAFAWPALLRKVQREAPGYDA